MSTEEEDSKRLEQALAVYLQLLDEGADGEAYLSENPELRSELRALGLLQQRIVELRPPGVERAGMLRSYRVFRRVLARFRRRLNVRSMLRRPRFWVLLGALGMGFSLSGALADRGDPASPIARFLDAVVSNQGTRPSGNGEVLPTLVQVTPTPAQAEAGRPTPQSTPAQTPPATAAPTISAPPLVATPTAQPGETPGIVQVPPTSTPTSGSVQLSTPTPGIAVIPTPPNTPTKVPPTKTAVPTRTRVPSTPTEPPPPSLQPPSTATRRPADTTTCTPTPSPTRTKTPRPSATPTIRPTEISSVTPLPDEPPADATPIPPDVPLDPETGEPIPLPPPSGEDGKPPPKATETPESSMRRCSID